ncbi:MAG: lactate utilization protein [Desulfonatronovibrionaceae bacterium]
MNKFIARAEAVSAVVCRITSMQEALEYTVKICDEKEACQMLLSGCELAVSDSAQELCQLVKGEKVIAAPALDSDSLSRLKDLALEKGIRVVSDGLRKYVSGLDIGLVVSELGLAETGTVVLDSSSEDLRLSTMLCEINIIVLPVSLIRSSTDEAGEELADMMKKGSAYLSFITGASRTADIERVLALGVHGPLELHILLLEDD